MLKNRKIFDSFMELTCELWFYISKILADYRIFGRKRRAY